MTHGPTGMPASNLPIDPPSTADTSTADTSALETHRAYVREVDRAFANVYGFGGGAVILATLLAWAALIGSGLLSALTAAMPAITTGLIALAILRKVVKKKRAGLKMRVLGYCATNNVDPHQLREYYAKGGLYPYFEAALATDAPPKLTDSTSK